jgi:hypothetical protein
MTRRIALLAAVVLIGGLTSIRTSARVPQIAILDSAYTRTYFSLHYPPCSLTPPLSYYLGAEEYQRYFRGWEYVLQTNGMPYTILDDADIENGALRSFDLLILSNNASLSDDEEKAVAAWVRKGGRLIATFGTGYKDIVADPRQADGLKLQKGGTFGLHELWHDPLTKLVTTNLFSPGIDIEITNYSGPTAGLLGQLPGNVLPYGALANVLVQRPRNDRSAYGFLMVPGYSRPTPAILLEDVAAGKVLYFAFAPEYIVSKEFDLPASPSCPDGQNWTGRSTALRILMRDSVLFMLTP